MKLHTLVPLTALTSALLLLSNPARADVAPDPPHVEITSPVDGATFDGPTASIDVVLDTFEGDEGVGEVMLQVDGTTVATDMDAPYGFEAVEVGAGMHVLVAVVTSAVDGAEYSSAEVNIVVFDEMGTDTGGSGGTGGSGDGGDGDEDGGNKCAVVDSNRLGGSGVMIVVGLLCLGLAGRRRRASVQA